MKLLKKIWLWLYPTCEHSWMPLIWLPFMLWFFIAPMGRHASELHWIINTIVGLIFILLYLQSFSRQEPIRTACVLLMLAIAATVIPFNGGAFCLLIYCAASASFTTNRWLAVPLIIVDIAVLAIYARRLHLPVEAWASMSLFILIIGLGTHFGRISHSQRQKLQLANDEIEHLAKVAERERIARDLHDVLGHTLSLITLKSELARKLVDRDPERAKLEMQDVENTSRAALADVREAIRGYRSDGFFAELSRARAALETAGVTLQCSTVPLELTPEQESVLALALREAVTNVVRHAEAQRCEVTLMKENSLCRLEISDDGRGCCGPEGNGLRGMRERLQAIGGSLERLTGQGTRLVIQLPLAASS